MFRVIVRARFLAFVSCVLFGALLLGFPRAAANGISRGLSVCGGVVVPAVFPFLVLGGILVRSGAAEAVGRRFVRITRWLFGVSGCAAPVILIAIIGGFPAGAVAVAGLRKRGVLSAKEGERLLRFCIGGGPGFIVSAVGVGLCDSAAVGWVLYAANVLSALVIGILFADRRQHETIPPKPLPAEPLSAAFVGAVTAACETVIAMCGFVLFFSAVLSLLDAMGWSSLGLSCLLEVSNGCAAAATHSLAPLLLGFTLGFGGVSVHCQIAAAVRGCGVMTRSFWWFRFLHGVLGGGFSLLLYRLLPFSSFVFGSNDAPVVRASYGSVTLSVFLLILCGVWLLSIPPLKNPKSMVYFSQRKGS